MKSSYSGFPEGLPIMLEPSGPNFAPHPSNWIGLYNKPVGFLNVNGFFDTFFAFLKDAVNAGFMPKPCYERAIVDSTASGLIDKLLAARLAPELPRNADCFDHK